MFFLKSVGQYYISIILYGLSNWGKIILRRFFGVAQDLLYTTLFSYSLQPDFLHYPTDTLTEELL